MYDKKNPRAVEDYKEGLAGKDQEGIFSERSEENAEGLKDKANMDEEEKREEEKKKDDDEDDDGDDGDDQDD